MTAEIFETFDEHLAGALRDPEFREAWDASEPAYQVARLRIMHGLTQAELARRVGTQQPSIARLESRRDEPTLPFLRRVAQALNARLEVHIVPLEEAPATRQMV